MKQCRRASDLSLEQLVWSYQVTPHMPCPQHPCSKLFSESVTYSVLLPHVTHKYHPLVSQVIHSITAGMHAQSAGNIFLVTSQGERSFFCSLLLHSCSFIAPSMSCTSTPQNQVWLLSPSQGQALMCLSSLWWVKLVEISA